MKKILFILAAAAVCIGVSGCGSTKLNSEVNTNAVIVSVYGNAALPWYELDKNGNPPSASQGLLSKALSNQFDEDNPEILTAVDRLDYAEDYLRKSLEENLGITTAEKEAVLKTKKYKMFSEGLLSSLNTNKTATGYKSLESIGTSDCCRLYKETGTNCAVILKFEFFKKLTGGSKSSGVMVPYIQMRATVYNEKGKEILYKTFKVEGEEFKFNRKDYDKDAFVALYPAAIEQTINQLCLELAPSN